ncbi:hypothetical protein H8D30_02285 [bacterium]|nr:hypothetical protein [bacterium]
MGAHGLQGLQGFLGAHGLQGFWLEPPFAPSASDIPPEGTISPSIVALLPPSATTAATNEGPPVMFWSSKSVKNAFAIFLCLFFIRFSFLLKGRIVS